MTALDRLAAQFENLEAASKERWLTADEMAVVEVMRRNASPALIEFAQAIRPLVLRGHEPNCQYVRGHIACVCGQADIDEAWAALDAKLERV